MTSDALSHAFGYWAADTASAKQDAAWVALQAQSKSLEAQLRQTRFETKKGTMLHVAHIKVPLMTSEDL